MFTQVLQGRVRTWGRLFEVGDTDELCPSEAISAVGVAGLARSGEHEDCLAVFMLQSWYRLVVELGDVGLELIAWVGVQLHPQFRDLGGALRARQIGADEIVYGVVQFR